LLVILRSCPSLLELGREVEFAALSIRANVGPVQGDKYAWSQRQFATGASRKFAVE
jgi:hypothetical protein